MITIRFESGHERRLKADSAAVEDEVLVIYAYTKDHKALRMTNSFPSKSVRWANLDGGNYVVGSKETRYD